MDKIIPDDIVSLTINTSVEYKNDVLNKIFELQQKYAWKAEDLYNLAHLSNFNNETLNALKEYSKFEGRATMCQDLIEEIENLNIYAKEKKSNV